MTDRSRNFSSRGSRSLRPTEEKKINKQNRRRQSLTSTPMILPPSFTPEMAVVALRNNESRLTTELKLPGGKLGSETKVTYPPELVAGLRSMFPSTMQYRFQLHSSFTVTTSAGGAALDVSPISPLATTYGEWSALSALFDEVKAVSSFIEYVNFAASSTGSGAVVLAFDEQNINTAPTSYAQVYRLAKSVCWNILNCDGGSGRHKQSHRFASRDWANTATPAVASPPSGMIGAWMLANGSVLTASVNYGLFNQTVVVRLRCRA